MKLCAKLGCDQVAVAGGALCPDHAAARSEREAERRQAAKGSQQALKGSRLYQSRAWQSAARSYLDRRPLCADCDELGAVVPATDVDHIVPHRGDRSLFWDRTNWQGLCKACHSRKTAREVLHRGVSKN